MVTIQDLEGIFGKIILEKKMITVFCLFPDFVLDVPTGLGDDFQAVYVPIGL